jgi:heme oxygenase
MTMQLQEDDDLYSLTREMHHGAQSHPFMQRMVKGEITTQEWVDWLEALKDIYEVIDCALPEQLRRYRLLLLDLVETYPVLPNNSVAAKFYVKKLTNPVHIIGACYIFSSANLRGGVLIRKRLEPLGFPCNHLRRYRADAKYDNKQLALEAEVELRRLRVARNAFEGANAAFSAVIDIASEIESRR